MNELTLFSENLKNLITKLLPRENIQSGFSVYKNSAVHIDFDRGNPEGRFLTVAGMVIGHQDFSVQINLKTKEGEKVLKSNCTCQVWEAKKHCPHVASLLFQYLLTWQKLNKDRSDSTESGTFFGKTAVTPKEYGTIISKANDLINSKFHSLFKNLKYQLENEKVVSFPQESSPFTGQIIFDYSTKTDFDPIEKRIISQSDELTFSVLENEEQNKLISIFECIHIFNWKNGDLYQLDNQLVDILKNIKIHQGKIDRYNILFFIKDFVREGKVKLSYNNYIASLDSFLIPKIKVELMPDNNKSSFLKLKLFFVFNDIKLPIPRTLIIYSIFTNNETIYKRKSDFFVNIETLLKDYNSDTEEYKKINRYLKRNLVFDKVTEAYFNREDEFQFSESEKKFVKYDHNLLHTLGSSLINSFGINSFKNSTLRPYEDCLELEILRDSFFNGLGSFYQELSPYDIEIYYQKNKIKNWSNNIRIKRNDFSQNWFNLGADIPDEDLSIIERINTENDYYMDNDEIVILTKEQKHFVQFLKKFKVDINPETGKKEYNINIQRMRIFEIYELMKLGHKDLLSQDELELCENLRNLKELPQYEVPKINDFSPRAYQLQGYQWLRFLFEHRMGACLADDMGLGKTLQAIMFFNSIYEKVEKILIVTPVSIIINWTNEFEKFSNLPINIYYGPDREFDPEAKITITSYGILKREYNTTFKDTHFDILLLDEVQHLKNYKSLGANAARTINAKFRLSLTGTPVENDISEFFNIIDLSVPGLWGDQSNIRHFHKIYSREMAKTYSKPFILRRTKDQVLTDLPEKIESHIYLNFSEEEEQRYKKQLYDIRMNLEGLVPQKKYTEVLKSLLSLRQLCLWQQNEKFISTKIKFLIQNLEQILNEGHQVIIFSQFTTYLDFIQKEITKNQWKFSRIDGSVPMNKRQAAVDAFQNGENPVFLISLKAGGVGLNLTAASYVFLMDPWWNPAVESQAIDRAHRIGQKNKLTVYRPIIKNSVEEKVLKLQQMKKELFEDLMSEKNNEFFNGKLTLKDFEQLLKD